MIVIRPESPADISAIQDVESKAFGRYAEADLVDALRSRGAVTLSLVALESDEVVGHVLFSPVTILGEGGTFSAVGLGPVAVLPKFQHRGIGSRLIQAGLDECRHGGHDAVVVLGSTVYYRRFSFRPATHLGLMLEGARAENFMALELRSGALSGKRGIVKYQPEFDRV